MSQFIMQSDQSKHSNLYSMLKLDTQLVVQDAELVVKHKEQNDYGSTFLTVKKLQMIKYEV